MTTLSCFAGFCFATASAALCVGNPDSEGACLPIQEPSMIQLAAVNQRMRADDNRDDMKSNISLGWPLTKKGATCSKAGLTRSTKAFNAWFSGKAHDARGCQDFAERFNMRFFVFEQRCKAKSCRYRKTCLVFRQCTVVQDEKSNTYDLYSFNGLWPLLASDVMCPIETDVSYPLHSLLILNGPQPDVSPFDEYNGRGRCQGAALKKMHHYFGTRVNSVQRCLTQRTCDEEYREGWTLYKKHRIDKTFQRVENTWCKDNNARWNVEILVVKDAADCAEKTVGRWGYYKKDDDFHVMFPPEKQLECWSFPTCISTGRVPAIGVSLYRRPMELWRTSNSCVSISGTPTLLGNVSGEEAETQCQELAVERDHRFFECTSDSCVTAMACENHNKGTRSTEKVREAPQGGRVTQALEHKLRNLLGKLVFANMNLPSKAATIINYDRWGTQASALRSVFHDAQDWNRLMLWKAGSWERVDVTSVGEYGGVDGCVYEPPTDTAPVIESDIAGAGFLNFNVQRRGLNQDRTKIWALNMNFARKACFSLCCSEGDWTEEEKNTICDQNSCDPGDYIAYPGDRCIVDMNVFGVNLIIEKAGGPTVPMTWGRRQANCRSVFAKANLAKGIDTRRIALFAAAKNTFYHPDTVLKDFHLLGFSNAEAAALMGGHSFGQVHKYTGGLDVRNVGDGFCDKPALVSPKLTLADMDDESNPPGNCDTSSGSWASGCYTNTKGQIEPTRQNNGEAAKRGHRRAWQHGGFFDRTPDAFDNDYFAMLNETDPEESSVCCGAVSQLGCTDMGQMQSWPEGKAVTGQGCETSWCMRSFGHWGLGRGPPKHAAHSNVVMLSTREYMGNKRFYRFSQDWAIILDKEARQEVARFARDNEAFVKAFGAVWDKIIRKGHSEVGASALYTASA